MKYFKCFYAIALLACVTFFCSFENVSDEAILSQGVSKEDFALLKVDSVHGKTGMIHFKECHANLKVPEGFVFLGKEEAKKLLVDYWENPESHVTDLLGVIIPKQSVCFYQVSMAYVVTYDNSGYIKDDDASSIDYNELLSDMKESTAEDNKSLPKEQQCTLEGWAVSPKYLSDKHVLVWAKSLIIGGDKVVNYDMRILGKEGLVSINAVTDPEDVKEVDAKGNLFINSLTYDSGYAYSDFDPDTDRVSDWTIGGLIAGGVLAKTGLFAKLGIFLVKCWKILAVAIFAVGGFFAKFFKRKRKDEVENKSEI